MYGLCAIIWIVLANFCIYVTFLFILLERSLVWYINILQEWYKT